MNHRGFTLIELIMVIALIGILAVFAAPQMGNITSMKAEAFSDKLRADIRYAQNLAMTQNQRVRVTFTAASYDVTIGGVVNHATDPANGKPYPVVLGVGDYSGIGLANTFTGSCLEFDSLGVPYEGTPAECAATAPLATLLAVNRTVTVTNGSVITITAQTGAVN
jgi:MSHA pilin protein MshC